MEESSTTEYGMLPAIDFIRQSQLIPVIIPFSAVTPWRKVKAAQFPAPVKLLAGVSAWRGEYVRAWIAQFK